MGSSGAQHVLHRSRRRPLPAHRRIMAAQAERSPVCVGRRAPQLLNHKIRIEPHTHARARQTEASWAERPLT